MIRAVAANGANRAARRPFPLRQTFHPMKTRFLSAALAAMLFPSAAMAAPGFIRAVFSHPGSGYDGTSDIWTADGTTVVLQPDVYSYTTPEETTYAYAAYMWCEADTDYVFRGRYDDNLTVKIDNAMVIAKDKTECSGRIGMVSFSESAWHKIEVRCSNNKGSGGANSSWAFAGVWMKKGTSGTFEKLSDPGDGSLFRTDEPDGYEDHVIDVPDSNFTFSLNEDCASVTLIGATDDAKNLVVPESHMGLPVTTIGNGAFQNHTTLQRVVLPETVTSIGDSAFKGCIALTSCNIPNGVTAIPEYCFNGCSKLRRIVLPAGLKTIGTSAFNGCSSLETVNFPEGLTSVGNAAFLSCSSLKEAILPDSMTSLGPSVFSGCSILVKAHLPNGLKAVPSSVFSYCSKLSEVNVPNGITSISGSAFWDCQSLREIVIPATVTSVGVDVFYGVQRVVFLGRPPAGLPKARVSTAVYPKEYGELWAAQIPVSQFGGFVKSDRAAVTIVSAEVRENDPTVLDVVYQVTSAKPTVKVRALAFEDGVRSFANVTRPETFVDNTAPADWDAVEANVEHTLSWKVSADFTTDLAKMKFEILAVEDGILPLELTTIPANGTNKAMEISWNLLTSAQVFDALLWLYADKTEGLTLTNGVLKNGDVQVASGATPTISTEKWVSGQGYVYSYPAEEFVFSKMGFAMLTGDALAYANELSRLGLIPGSHRDGDGIRQYAYRWIDGE